MALLAGKYKICMFSSVNSPRIYNCYFSFSPSFDIYIQSRFTCQMAVFCFLIYNSQYIYLLRNWCNKDFRAGWASDNGILRTTLLWRAFLTHWALKSTLTDTRRFTCLLSVLVHRRQPSRWVTLPVRPPPQRRDRLPHADLREALPHRAGDAASGRRSGRGRRQDTRWEGKVK